MNTVKDRPAARPRGMGRVFQRRGSAFWWISYYHGGKEIRESSESTNPRVAEKFLTQRLREVGADQLGARRFIGPKRERVTVADLLDAMERHYKLDGTLSPQVLAHVKPIREAFGDRRAVDLTVEMVDRYMEERLKPQPYGEETIPGKAPATVNRETQLLGQAFRLAIQENRLNAMPAIRHLSETGNVRQGFFEREEFEAVVVHLPEELQDFARFAFFTGWRKGEITSLRWVDVDGHVIRLRPEAAKNKHGRQVPLEGDLRAIMERRWSARQFTAQNGTAALSNYVFHRDGAPVGDIRKSWATACTAAKVAGRLFHDLRRTAVRNMVRAGVPETVAMAISGHRTRAVFDRYNITSEKDLREAVQRTQAHLNQGRGTVVLLPVLPIAQVPAGRGR